MDDRTGIPSGYAHETATAENGAGSGTSEDSSMPRRDENRPVFDRSALLARIGGNEECANRLTGMFVTLTEDMAPQLAKAVTEGDMAGAGSILHSLKGAAGNIGAERIYRLLTEFHARTGEGCARISTESLVELGREFEDFRKAVSAPRDGGMPSHE